MLKFINNFIFLVVIIFLSLNSCSSTKDTEEKKGEVKKTYEPNLDKRLKQYEGQLFDKATGKNKSNEFGVTNIMWRASLLVLKDIPLASVDYSGGIIVTDWYSNGTNESIKINISFNNNEVAVSSIEVKAFKKICNAKNECSISNGDESFTKTLKDKIINKIREIKSKDSK